MCNPSERKTYSTIGGALAPARAFNVAEIKLVPVCCTDISRPLQSGCRTVEEVHPRQSKTNSSVQLSREHAYDSILPKTLSEESLKVVSNTK